ncbi:MAG: hypothetical protein ABJP66_07805 [Hyphomicrobiales bacterium]
MILKASQRGGGMQLYRHLTNEAKARSSRLPTGIKALWFRVTGKFNAIKKQNEDETRRAKQCDLDEQQALIEKQKAERRPLQHRLISMRHKQVLMMRKLDRYVPNLSYGQNQVSERNQSGSKISRKKSVRSKARQRFI